MVADSWGDTADGAICMQAPWNGGNNRHWRLNSVGSSRYQIINRGTGTALDSLGDRTVDSAAACGHPTPTPSNQWTITAA
jgi:alpha-L-fucosidase